MSRVRHQPTAPGPGDYNVYASGIEDRIRPSCQSVGTMYYKPTARTERAMKIKDCDDAQSKEIGPGYYNSTRGLNVVRPRSAMLVNIQSESKSTPAALTQSYWEQKASDLRETHDEDRPANHSIISARVQSVSIAPPKNVNIRSEKQLSILIRKKLQDVDMRSRGNYYNAKYDSSSWVKQPLTTKQTAREIARRVNRRRQLEIQHRHDLIEQLLAEGEEKENDLDENDHSNEKEDKFIDDGNVSPTEELVDLLASDVYGMTVQTNTDDNKGGEGGGGRIRSDVSVGVKAGRSQGIVTVEDATRMAHETTKFEKEITAAYLRSLKKKKSTKKS